MTAPTETVTICKAVARAIDRLSLPGESREDTIARIVWAFGTAETRAIEDPRAPRR